MAPQVPTEPAVRRLLPTPTRSTFLFGPRGTGKSTFARQAFPEALHLDLRAGPVVRDLLAAPERLHGLVAAMPRGQWVVLDEIQRAPILLDVVHQCMDRDPKRHFLMTGSGARAIHRAGVNLLGGRAGRRVMPPFLAAELGDAFDLDLATRIGLLPIVLTADDPPAALIDYVTVAVLDEVRAEATVRQLGSFARVLEQLSLAHGGVLSPTAIGEMAQVKKSTVIDWIELLASMFLVSRVEVFTARPSRRALAVQPKLYFADAGIAMALRSSQLAQAATEAVGASREGLVYQHLAAWCDAQPGARLWTWRTPSLEVDFVVESAAGLVAIEVKSGATERAADRKGLLAFHDEFPDAHLLLLNDAALPAQRGPISVRPLSSFLRGITPGAPLAW